MGSLSPDPPNFPKPWVKTPLIFSPALSRAAGCNIYLKLENTQPSGSFKSRGIGNMMLASTRRAAAATATSPSPSPSPSPSSPMPDIRFFCSSGGNAGLACAATAAALRRPATIVVPHATSAFMVGKLRELGARVVQTGAGWAEADAFVRETLLRPGSEDGEDGEDGKDGASGGGVVKVYVPPFDHPDIWAGVATLVDELVADVDSTMTGGLDAVVCNVGGGGLLNGVMEGLERNGGRLGGAWGRGRQRPVVLAVETAGADSLHASVRAGELVTLPAITSIATSLGARTVSKKTWEWVQRAGPEGLVSATVTDGEAAAACVRFLDDARILIEVACGATVATAYNGDLRRYLGKGLTDEEWAGKNVVLVVCGGSNINLEILEKYKATYGIE